jgi:hypothetical protein
MIGETGYDWHDWGSALWRFAVRKSQARRSYMKFLEEGVGREINGWRFGSTEMEGGDNAEADDRLAGDAEFVRRALRAVREPKSPKREIIRSRPSLDQVLVEVSAAKGIDTASALGRGRNDIRSEARSEFCRLAIREHYYTVREVAGFLGINASSVSRLCGRVSRV